MVMVTETDSFVAALRTQSQRYHSLHPFHLKMNEGVLSRRQIQGWVANRICYQENIPRKDGGSACGCECWDRRRAEGSRSGIARVPRAARSGMVPGPPARAPSRRSP